MPDLLCTLILPGSHNKDVVAPHLAWQSRQGCGSPSADVSNCAPLLRAAFAFMSLLPDVTLFAQMAGCYWPSCSMVRHIAPVPAVIMVHSDAIPD